MEKSSKEATTPGSNQSPADICPCIPGSQKTGFWRPGKPCNPGKSEFPHNRKHTTKFATLNIRTLVRPGKLLNLTEKLAERKIKLIALQETRFTDENHMNYNRYRFLKGKPARKAEEKTRGNSHQYGTAFAIHESILHHIIDFNSASARMSTLSLRFKNKGYTLVNCHAPTNDKNHTDKEQVEKFWNELEREMQKIPKHHTTILLGDFNAQIGKEKEHIEITGKFSAHKKTNENGLRLVEICRITNAKIMSTSIANRKSRKVTWTSPNEHMGEFQIDHVTINKPHIQDIRNVRVHKSVDMDSDHYLTEITMNIIPNRNIAPVKQRKIDPELLLKNKDKIDVKLDPQKTWEETSKEITENITKLTTRKRRKRHPWWNANCDDEIDKRANAWKKFTHNRTSENWTKFLQTQKKANNTIRNTRRGYDKELQENLEVQLQKNNTREFYKIFRQQTSKFNPQTLHFMKHDGKLAMDNKTNLKLLQEYFKTLLNCEKPAEKFDSLENPTRNANSQPPGHDEIRKIIRELHNNKAAGEDSIIAEVWKSLGEPGVEYFHTLLQKIWHEEKIPEGWKNAIIVPLHKKGSKSDVNNYRGISLLPVTYKILSKALLTRLEQQIDHQIGEYQAGFRKQRSTTEQILNVKNILNFRKLRNKKTCVVFVDFKKAYDSIDRETLINTLMEFGVDHKTTELIKQTLTNTKSKVKFQGELSEEFSIETGLRQGDGLSPLLFNIVLEKIIREVTIKLEQIPGIRLGRCKNDIKFLAFADDIAILTGNEDDARTIIETLHETAQKTGLKISYEKTEYFMMKSNIQKLHTKYGDINRVTKFKYLGEMIQQNGGEEESNRERYNKLQKLYFATQHRYNKKTISLNAKLRHYNTVVKPVALYASETLELTRKTDMEKLEKLERKIIRKIIGPRTSPNEFTYRPKSNEEVYKHIEKITTTMRKRRLKLYGHIQRLEDTKLTKQITKIIDQKSTTTWMKQVRRDLQNLNTTDFQNRAEYRKAIYDANFTDEPTTKRRGQKWTEERRENFKRTMRLRWENVKKAGLKWRKC